MNDEEVVLSILTFRGGTLGTENNRIIKKPQVKSSPQDKIKQNTAKIKADF